MSSKHPGSAAESEYDHDVESQTEDSHCSSAESFEIPTTTNKRFKTSASICGNNLRKDSLNSAATIAEGETTPKHE